MMEVNNYQIGGKHYIKDYQHWDMVCDTSMPYLLGCATKYIDRWRKKNGVEDLRKAVHYIAKAGELGIYMPEQPVRDFFLKIIGKETYQQKQARLFGQFINQPSNTSTNMDKKILIAMFKGNYKLASNLITLVIEHELSDGSEPTSAYVSQDPDYIYFRG